MMNTDDEMKVLRTALEASLRALNCAPSFSFTPGGNPLQLRTNPRGEASSYDLAARIESLLAANDADR
jgi:hypothetical protein